MRGMQGVERRARSHSVVFGFGGASAAWRGATRREGEGGRLSRGQRAES